MQQFQIWPTLARTKGLEKRFFVEKTTRKVANFKKSSKFIPIIVNNRYKVYAFQETSELQRYQRYDSR